MTRGGDGFHRNESAFLIIARPLRPEVDDDTLHSPFFEPREGGFEIVRLSEFAPATRCKNPKCSKPILLPLPTHPGTPPNQAWWPTDAQPRNISCPWCKHVYEYSSEDSRLEFSHGGDPRRIHRGCTVVYIEVPCDKESCEARIEILAIMEKSTELRENALQLLSQMMLHEIHCSPANHPFLATSRETGKSLQLGLDRDWMPYQE